MSRRLQAIPRHSTTIYKYLVGLLLVSFVSLDVTFDISDGRLDPSFDTSRRL